MALADELAYMTATDMAARIRRRQLSPVEVVDAVIERIEARNPSLNAFVFKGYEDARKRAEQAEHAIVSGEELGPLHGVPTAMKDLFDFKPGWPATFGGVRALKDLVIDAYCVFAERVEKAGAILIGKTNSPVMGFRGVCDNYLFGPSAQPVRHDHEHRRLLRRQRSGGRRRPRAVRRGHRRRRLDPHPRGLVRRLRLQGVIRPRADGHAARRLRGARTRSSTRGRSRARSRTRRSC